MVVFFKFGKMSSKKDCTQWLVCLVLMFSGVLFMLMVYLKPGMAIPWISKKSLIDKYSR